MAVRIEQFTTGTSPPDALWSVVGDPRRLPEWTDADEVVAVDPEPLAPGTVLVVVVDGAEQRWELSTVEPRLLEARTDTPRGRLGVGVRVAADPRGSRLVLAASIESPGAAGGLRARLVDAPALRRRFDRWAEAALQRTQEG